jgi:hypothetical protein
MRYFFTRLLLVAAPLFAWQIVELFVLPPNYFTFRPWEAARVHNDGLFRGPFYPNQRIEMWSAGDLNPRGLRKTFVRFRTDDYGYRNPQPYNADTRYQFLLVGDSQFAGPNLHERDTLGVVLEREYGRPAYNYASGCRLCQSFIQDTRIAKNPPKFVVLDFRPEEAFYGRFTNWPRCTPVNDSLQAMLCDPVPLWHRILYQTTNDDVRIMYDRATRQHGYNWLRARMNLALRKPLPGLTLQQAERNILDFINAMVSLQGELRARGMTLVLLLVPVPYPEGVGDYVAGRLSPQVPMVHWQSGSPYRSDLATDPWFDEDDSHMSKLSILKCAYRIIELTSSL